MTVWSYLQLHSNAISTSDGALGDVGQATAPPLAQGCYLARLGVFERMFPIYDLGDGLQGLIILTFLAFTQSEHCLFFIEEPDLYMHPGLQRALVETLLDQPRHQYFMTTHSNHLLDMTLDYSNMSIFLFRKNISDKKVAFTVSNVSLPDTDVLRELGVRSSSVFLTNTTIWVEGITDRRYLRTYMERYLNELESSDKEKFELLRTFQEDCHYSFVEYQGAQIVHWSFDAKEDGSDSIMANRVLVAIRGRNGRVNNFHIFIFPYQSRGDKH